MTCHEVRQHWMLYLDSEGDAELHLRISDHLAMCPTCAEWFARQQRFEHAFTDRLSRAEATPQLWARVLARAGLRASAVVQRRRALGVAALAAAVLLAVGILFRFTGAAHAHDLSTVAADWHEQLLD